MNHSQAETSSPATPVWTQLPLAARQRLLALVSQWTLRQYQKLAPVRPGAKYEHPPS